MSFSRVLPFRYLVLLTISISSIIVAVFLRGCRGNAFREKGTILMGYKWRAAAEHFFSGLGVPLFTGFIFIFSTITLCCASYWICQRIGRPLARHPSEIMTLQDLGKTVACFSIVYIIAAFVWELSQASSRNGTVQLEQLSADLLGALFAWCLASTAYGQRELVSDRNTH
ncbi:hypothetical protein [Chitinimonas sp. JJ19]|uniref:hypothetical protein n=1 Tax=Chitinimonas sp. JJ19 TaxID=3109352 RepID=UPI003002DDE3